MAAGDVFAMNFLMDRDADHWAAILADLKAMGTCETGVPISPTGALSGDFTWRCERGRVNGQFCLPPRRRRAFNPSRSLAKARNRFISRQNLRIRPADARVKSSLPVWITSKSTSPNVLK